MGPYRFSNGQQLPAHLHNQWLLVSASLWATVVVLIVCEWLVSNVRRVFGKIDGMAHLCNGACVHHRHPGNHCSGARSQPLRAKSGQCGGVEGSNVKEDWSSPRSLREPRKRGKSDPGSRDNRNCISFDQSKLQYSLTQLNWDQERNTCIIAGHDS